MQILSGKGRSRREKVRPFMQEARVTIPGSMSLYGKTGEK
jgi:hypothetical protein